MGAEFDVDAPQVHADGLQAEGVGAAVEVRACGGPEVQCKKVVVVRPQSLARDGRDGHGDSKRCPRASEGHSCWTNSENRGRGRPARPERLDTFYGHVARARRATRPPKNGDCLPRIRADAFDWLEDGTVLPRS